MSLEIVKSTEVSAGIGEPGVLPVARALANAIAWARQSKTALPMTHAGVKLPKKIAPLIRVFAAQISR